MADPVSVLPFATSSGTPAGTPPSGNTVARIGDGGIDLTALIQLCTAAQTGAAQLRGITLRTDLDPLLPARVQGDADALALVLHGLFTTILKASAAGGVLLRVRRNGYGSRGPHLLFRVEAPVQTFADAPDSASLPLECRAAAERLGGMIGIDSTSSSGLVGWCEIEMTEGGPRS